MVGDGGAVGAGVESVDCVGDEGVKGLGGGDEVADAGGEAGDFGVEIDVGGVETGELVLEVLVEVDSGVPVVDEGVGAFDDFSVAIGIVAAVSATYVSVDDLADRPAVADIILEFLVEGNAHGSGGGESCSAGGGGHVNGLSDVMSAVSAIENPVVVGTAGRDSSGVVVGVFVEIRQSDLGIIIGTEARVCVYI